MYSGHLGFIYNLQKLLFCCICLQNHVFFFESAEETGHNWPFATHYVHAGEKYTAENVPTDKTEQLTLGMKQSLSFQMFSLFYFLFKQ